MRVLDVEVVAVVDDVLSRDAPGVFVFLALFEAAVFGAPPLLNRVELFERDRLGLVVALDALRVGVFVVPDVLGRRVGPGEEQEVGSDGGVGGEDAVGQADDGVEVELFEELFLDAGLNALAEERAIREDQPGPAAGLEEAHEQDQEEVGGLAGSELGGEVGLDAILFHAAEGRVGDDAVDAVLGAPVLERAGKRVVVLDGAGHVDAVQQKIRHAEDVGQVLLFNPAEAFLKGLLVLGGLALLAEVVDGAGEEAPGAAGGVEDGFAQARVDLLDDEAGDGPGGIKLPGVAGGLEVAEELFVDVAEEVAVVGGVEVDAVDLVDDLAHQRAVLHVVVGVLEDLADERADLAPGTVQGLELGQEGVVDEVEQGFAGHAFFIVGPRRPAEMLRQGRLVIVAGDFEFLLAVVEDFKEEHPAELFEALGVAVGAGVLAHDVLDGLDEIGDVGHGFISPLQSRCLHKKRRSHWTRSYRILHRYHARRDWTKSQPFSCRV